jgi:hypothetical protein
MWQKSTLYCVQLKYFHPSVFICQGKVRYQWFQEEDLQVHRFRKLWTCYNETIVHVQAQNNSKSRQKA